MIRQLVELAVRYAVPQVIYETSIEIQGEADSAAAARSAVDDLGARGLASPREIEAGRKLVAYLLESKPMVRRATAEGLAALAAHGCQARGRDRRTAAHRSRSTRPGEVGRIADIAIRRTVARYATRTR